MSEPLVKLSLSIGVVPMASIPSEMRRRAKALDGKEMPLSVALSTLRDGIRNPESVEASDKGIYCCWSSSFGDHSASLLKYKEISPTQV